MAKGKTPLTEGIKRYISRLEEDWNNQASKLDEALYFYVMQAKLALISTGYMTENGKWLRGYDADALVPIDTHQGFGMFPDVSYHTERDKLKCLVNTAVEVLIKVRECRENARLGHMEDAVLDMESIVRRSDELRWLHRASPKGRDRRNMGLVEAVERIRSNLKGKATAGTILRQFRLKHNSPQKALVTHSGFRVYLAVNEILGQERFFIIDRSGKRGVSLGIAAFAKTYLK